MKKRRSEVGKSRNSRVLTGRERRDRDMLRTRVFESRAEERAWLETTIAEIKVRLEDIEKLVRHIEEISDRSSEDVLRPGRLQRLADAGRSRAGRMETIRAEGALNHCLALIAEHPYFSKDARAVTVNAQQDTVPQSMPFSRAMTKFRLRQQAVELRKTMAEVQRLTRSMRLYMRQLESEEKKENVEESMDRVLASVDRMISDARKKRNNR